MEILVWIGAVLTLCGLGALGWCIFSVIRARRARLPEEAMKARLRTVVAVNMAALGVSAIGLMLVVVGSVLA